MTLFYTAKNAMNLHEGSKTTTSFMLHEIGIENPKQTDSC